MFVRQKSQSTFRTGKNLLILDHFSNWKMTVHQSIIHQCSFPTWELSLPFSIRKSSPRAPTWVRKLFHLEQKLYQDVCLSAHLYWRITFSFLDFMTDNVMLDFKCTSVWNTSFLWRLHVALINKVYHCWKTGTYPCGTSSVIMRSDLLSNHLDTISLL